MVTLKIGATDKALQKQSKALGGRWDPEHKVWYIPYGCIAGTRLEKLIVETTKETRETKK